jgi:hypothetical protein
VGRCVVFCTSGVIFVAAHLVGGLPSPFLRGGGWRGGVYFCVAAILTRTRGLEGQVGSLPTRKDLATTTLPSLVVGCF